MSRIYIKYLGQFEISNEENVTVSIKSNKNRVKKLLGMLTYGTKTQYSDTQLVERVWQEESVANKDTALTNLAYLARKTLKPLDDDIEFIIREDGKYLWNPAVEVDSDLKQIERSYKLMLKDNLLDEEKLGFGLEIVSLYKDELATSFDYDAGWLPSSEYYNNIFLEAAAMSCDILEKAHDKTGYGRIINIAAKASRYELGSDRFYIYIFKALKALNRRTTIIEYYESLNKTFFNKVGEPLGDEIKKIYAWATRSEDFTFDDLAALTESLRERSNDSQIKGAFYCDRDMFKTMAHFILRNSMRNNHDLVVMMITIYKLNDAIKEAELDKGLTKLEDVIRKTFRKDDVFSRYSTNQFLVMPFECKKDKISIIEDRLLANFEKANNDTDFAIDVVNFSIDEDGYELIF